VFVVSTFTAAEILFSKLLILLQLIQFADYKTITKHTFSYIKSNRNYTYLNQQQLHEDSMYYLWSVLVITAHGLFNPLMGTLKLQNNGPLYSNIVIGTLGGLIHFMQPYLVLSSLYQMQQHTHQQPM